jgi:hypothetical protein
MEPIKTANGQYEYTEQLNILVQKAHKYNCDETKYDDLSNEEKQKDLILASFLLDDVLI